jgi:intraflagellar transport protein 88
LSKHKICLSVSLFSNSGDWSSSIQYYQEALRVDAECSEALYNLGIACKRVDRKEDALESFIKLHQIQRTNPQVMFMIADVYRLMGDNSAAVEWLQQALSVSHNDPKLLQELGAIFDNEGDKSSAFQV